MVADWQSTRFLFCKFALITVMSWELEQIRDGFFDEKSRITYTVDNIDLVPLP